MDSINIKKVVHLFQQQLQNYWRAILHYAGRSYVISMQSNGTDFKNDAKLCNAMILFFPWKAHWEENMRKGSWN